MKEGHVVLWVQIYPVPEWRAHQGKKRGSWIDAPIMPSAYCTSMWGQCNDLGFLQLVRSSFSNIMCLKDEVSWLPEYTKWPGQSISVFFLPWWHRHIPRWQCQDSLGSNCEREVQRAWDRIFTHGLATTESRPEPHWESLECAGEGFAQWSDSSIINTRS